MNVLQRIAVIAAVVVSAPAWPQDSGFYIGASAGQSEAKDFCDGANTGASFSCDGKDTAIRGFAGYQINRHLALELGYADLGVATQGVVAAGILANARYETTAWDLVAVGSLPLLEKLSVFGKAGWYRAETELSGGGSSLAPGTPVGTPPVAFRGEETNNGLTFGFGARYAFTPRFGVRAEWQRYQEVGGPDVGGEADVDVLSVGLQYRF